MATPNLQKTTSSTPAGTATTTSSYSTTTRTQHATRRGNQVFLFDKSNYMWMLAGFICIILGFLLMAGGKSPDPHKFDYSDIYSARRITLAPLLILIGFAIEAYAIMKKPKDQL